MVSPRIETNLIVDGRVVEGERTIEVRNPAWPDEVVGICHAANAKQAEEAIEAAWKAYPVWRRLGIKERANILEKASARWQRIMLEWPVLQTREQGMVFSESVGEVLYPTFLFGVSSFLADMLIEQEAIQRDYRGWMRVKRDPIGVVSIITPWNAPLILTWLPVTAALLAGNTVVIKPASYTPLTISRTVEALADIFPPGVINIVPGSASEVGTVLTTHPLVGKVSLTGTCETGTLVMRNAADTTKKITLELGGNDPAIILPDIDWSLGKFQQLLWGVFTTAGQICMAIKRIYVHESIFQRFIDDFVDVASQIVVGNGLDERVTMGPLNNKEQLEKVRGLVQEAEKRGAKVIRTGKILDKKTFNKGYFHLPTIITGVDHTYRVVKEEQFGPVIPIMPFRDDEEAVRLANDTMYGLCSSVWTTDEDRGAKIAEQLEAGYTWLNQHGPLALELMAPFGGQKRSGIGRSYGLEGLLAYTESHTIVSKTPVRL